VPIVSNVQGSRDIVTNGLDGLVVAHNKESLEQAMVEASLMSNEKYERFSKNARRKVIRKFSIESWAVRLNEFYKEIES
jgi:glycosyltransferase involved in cell wall biosynthesis